MWVKIIPLETTVPFEFAPSENFQAFSKYKQVSFLPVPERFNLLISCNFHQCLALELQKCCHFPVIIQSK